MNDEPTPSPAERRLEEHLELLRALPPEPETALVATVVRTARWQQALRSPLRVIGMIGSALVDGMSVLLGGPRRSR